MTFNNESNFEKFSYDGCPSFYYDVRFSVSAVNACGESERLYGRVDRNCFSVAMQQDNVTIYPNPSSGTINLFMDQGNVSGVHEAGMITIDRTPLKCVITDISGKKVKEIELLDNQEHVVIEGLSKGVYIVRIVDRNESFKMRKIIVY